MDLTLYWFMFPVSIMVATTAMMSGIGGAAFFTPIFLVIFPLLGPEYAISPVQAVGTALLIETFGFSSGFVGYCRKGLIDFRSALPFIAAAVPVGIAGALLAGEVPGWAITGGYAMLMVVLGAVMLRHHEEVEIPLDEGALEETLEGTNWANAGETTRVNPIRAGKTPPHTRTITDRDGQSYTFAIPRLGLGGTLVTAIGALLTGLLSVGIGEVTMPQLAKRNRVPIPVAAATSVLVVIITVALTSFTHIAALIKGGGLAAVPWHLVAYTVPAVVIGGQIGPRMQGRVAHKTMERIIGSLFLLIAIAMLFVAYNKFVAFGGGH